MTKAANNLVCRRTFERGCAGCPLVRDCQQEGFLPTLPVEVRATSDYDLKVVLAFAQQAGLNVSEVTEANPRTFVLTR